MAEIETPVAVDGVNEIRNQLMRRIAIAGVIIVSLVAGLAAFDASNVADTAVPVAPVAVAPQSEAKPESAPEPKPEAAADAAPAPSLPALPNATDNVTTASNAVEANANQNANRGVPEKTAGQISAPPVAASAVKKTAVATPAEGTRSPSAPPLREVPRALTKPATAQTVSTKPSMVAPVTTPEPAKALNANASAPVRPFTQTAADSARHYVVQMGVFSNVANAQDLYAKLQKAGIPSQIEARVHVGPFANRAEAEAAQKKLSELGLDGGMLVTSRK